MSLGLRLPFVALALIAASLVVPFCAYGTNSAAIQILLNEASYWRSHGRSDLAVNSWEKVLEADPNQPQALAGAALIDARVGRLNHARRYLRRLREVNPGNPAIGQISGLLEVGPEAGPELARAAQEADKGHYIAAMSIYRRVFKGSPPAEWATAYYQTLAKVPGGWTTAIDELRVQDMTRHPASPYRLVLGQLLSYHADTRVQGIKILAKLGAGTGATAASARIAWRMGLVWMGRNPVAIPYLRQYLVRYSDPALQHQLHQAAVLEAHIEAQRAVGVKLRIAYSDLRAGHTHKAKRVFGEVFEAGNSNAKALEGLGDVAMRQGHYDLAATDYARAQSLASSAWERGRLARLVQNALYWHWMRHANRAFNKGDYPIAIHGYRQALHFERDDPGALAALAGLYRYTGHKNKANVLLRRLSFAKPHTTRAWLYALQLLARLGDMRQVLTVKRYIPTRMRARLANHASYESIIVQAEADTGHADRAIHRLKKVIGQEGDTPRASLEIQLGWLLYRTEHTRALHALLVRLQTRRDLAPLDRTELRALYLDGARREAQRAIKQGHPRVASAIVANLTSRFPHSRSVERVRAAILVQEGHFHQAVSVLRKYGIGKSAGGYELGVGAALADHSTRQAGAWLKAGRKRYPHNVVLAQMAARLDLSQDRVGAARRELTAALATLPASTQTVAVSSQAVKRYPFAGDFLAPAPTMTNSGLPDSVTGVPTMETDATRTAIMQKLIAIDAHTSPFFGAAFFGRARSGTAGLGQEDIFGTQFEVSTVFGYNTRVTARLTPVAVNTGGLSGSAANLIGTAPIYGSEPGNYENAAGLALAVTLSQPGLGITLGSSPLGFPVHSVIGDVRWQPSGSELALRAFRRDVTDSALSYAGVKDPHTGLTWGGVFASGLGIDFGSSRAHHTIFSSLSFAALDGENVEQNSRAAVNVGASWPIVEQRLTRVGIGFDVLSMFYSHNLSNFTYGQGGYFSPQYYFRPALTTRWVGKSRSHFFYRVNALVGYQVFYQDASPYFPTNATMQAQSSNAYYPSQTIGDIGYGLRFTGVYAWTAHLFIGGFVHSDNSQNYSDLAAGLFVRYSIAPQSRTSMRASSAMMATPWLLGLDRPRARP